jgi:hypothetical protein
MKKFMLSMLALALSTPATLVRADEVETAKIKTLEINCNGVGADYDQPIAKFSADLTIGALPQPTKETDDENENNRGRDSLSGTFTAEMGLGFSGRTVSVPLSSIKGTRQNFVAKSEKIDEREAGISLFATYIDTDIDSGELPTLSVRGAVAQTTLSLTINGKGYGSVYSSKRGLFPVSCSVIQSSR